jgi:plastocyanin
MQRRLGVSRSIAVVGVVILLIAVGVGYGLYATMAPNATKSSSSSTTTQNHGSVTVSLPSGVGSNTNLDFQPATITVVIGVNNTINWVNQDSVQHTVTSSSVPTGASSFDSGALIKGATFSVTLTTVGTYQYHCSIHPGWMKGTITVKA